METNVTGSWLSWLDEEAWSLCEKFSPFPLPSAERGPCCMVPETSSRQREALGLSCFLGRLPVGDSGVENQQQGEGPDL